MLARMRASRLFRVAVVFAFIAGIASVPAIASACTVVAGQQSCSNNYSVGQTYFGSGGQLGTTGNGCSTNYCAVGSVGDLSDGNSTNTVGGSGNQVQAGSYGTTSRNPSITLVVNGGTNNLGYLSTSSTTTTDFTFNVKTYLASGYTLQIKGTPPTSNTGHQLTPITTAGGANAATGTEQFGVNMVANTSPSVGASPVCNPVNYCNYPSEVTLGSGYGTLNKFYYPSSGLDTLATSTTSTGVTDYELSFIYDINTSTPAGLYTYNGTIIATSTF